MAKSKVPVLIEELLKLVNQAKLTQQEMIDTLSQFMFSIGSSLENHPKNLTSEDILIRYAEEPRIGNALMAQAMHMKETWSVAKERENDRKTKKNRRSKTKRSNNKSHISMDGRQASKHSKSRRAHTSKRKQK